MSRLEPNLAVLALALAFALCGCDEKDKQAAAGPSASSLSAPEQPFQSKAPEAISNQELEAMHRGSDGPGLNGSGSAGAGPARIQTGGALAAAVDDPGRIFDGSSQKTAYATLGLDAPAVAGPAAAPAGAPVYEKRAFRRRASDPTPVRIGRLPGGALTYDSGMTIDTDGFIRDPHRRSAVFRQDPDHRSGTAFRYADGSPLDPTVVPFIVLPKGYKGASNGDLAEVRYRGRTVLAVVGDRGPRRSLGEASVAAAEALGIDSNGGHGGVEDGVTYTVYPGTGKGRPRDQAELLDFIRNQGQASYQVAFGR